MKNLIDALVGNPVLFAVAVIVSIFILLSFAKRIVRMVLVLLAMAVLYAAWLTWHGESVSEKAEKARRTVNESAQKSKGVMKFVDGVRKMGGGSSDK